MNKINEIIAMLIAIQSYAKDIHYNCKGDAFYSKHLLCDRVSENIYDYIDSIKEVCFLATGQKPLESSKYLQLAITHIPEIYTDKEAFDKLSKLIAKALVLIEELTDLSKGEENLFGAIAENLQTSFGLLLRQVA